MWENISAIFTPHSAIKLRIHSQQRNISSNQLFSYFFSKNVAFTKFLPKKLSVCTCGSKSLTVWKLRNFTATIFSQKFRKSNFLLKNSTLNWFDEKNCMAVNFSFFHTVFLELPHCAHCVTEILSHNSFMTKISWNQRFY